MIMVPRSTPTGPQAREQLIDNPGSFQGLVYWRCPSRYPWNPLRPMVLNILKVKLNILPGQMVLEQPTTQTEQQQRNQTGLMEMECPDLDVWS